MLSKLCALKAHDDLNVIVPAIVSELRSVHQVFIRSTSVEVNLALIMTSCMDEPPTIDLSVRDPFVCGFKLGKAVKPLLDW